MHYAAMNWCHQYFLMLSYFRFKTKIGKLQIEVCLMSFFSVQKITFFRAIFYQTDMLSFSVI